MSRIVIPEDLYKVVKLPEEDIQSGRHSCAECSGGTLAEPCRRPVAYRMTIEEYPFDEGNYNTEFFCHAHRPEDDDMNG